MAANAPRKSRGEQLAAWRKNVKDGNAVDPAAAIRDRQGQLMAMDAITGLSRKQIAAKYQVSPETVSKRLDNVLRTGFLDHFIMKMLEELMPKALTNYEMALEDGDMDASRDILQMCIGALQKAPVPEAPRIAADNIQTLEEYRIYRLQKVKEQLPEVVVEGEMVKGEPDVVPVHEGS